MAGPILPAGLSLSGYFLPGDQQIFKFAGTFFIVLPKSLFLLPLSIMSFEELITFFLIAVGLSFDSFAVSVSCGLVKQEIRFRQAVVIALSLAFFQGGFPFLGWLAVNSLRALIAVFDHWIAFVLLVLVGVKMLVEGIKPDGSLHKCNPFKWKVLLGLSVATSIDALVVGLSFGFLDTEIWNPVIIIFLVTFIASMLGMLFGKNITAKQSHRSLIPGGIILILIGFKILIEHLWFHQV